MHDNSLSSLNEAAPEVQSPATVEGTSHDGSVLIEHPVNHDSESMWPIKGRESSLETALLFLSSLRDGPFRT